MSDVTGPQQGNEKDQRAESIRLTPLDYVFRALAILSAFEVGALAYNIATHPGAPGILNQGLLPRIILGLAAGPSIVLFSVLLLWRAPRNVAGRFLLLLGMSEIGLQFAFDFRSPVLSGLVFDLFLLFASGVGAPSLGYLMLNFPTGTVYPLRWAPWVRAVAAVKFLGAALEIVASSSFMGMAAPPVNPLFIPLLAPYLPLIAATIGVRGALLPLISLMGIVSLALRYRSADRTVRQQIKWIIWAPGVGILGALVALALLFSGMSHALLYVALTFFSLAQLTLLAALTIAILRYHLFDIDQLINRTLVYGILTVVVIALYGLVVGLFSVLFQTSGSDWISLVATGLIAIVFQPAREYVQRSVNRLVYGERDEPYTALARLGQRLETTLSSEAILPTIVETVAQALKLPYAAIELAKEEGPQIAATYPPAARVNPSDGVVRLPLVYQYERVGELILAPRAGDKGFAPADQRLLEQFAHQAGVAAYAVRLTLDLQQSRERLVLAREEERRRIRRDLHDGLGPALAAQTLQVGSARALLDQNPTAADQVLADLERDIQAALADIRRLVYDLRPPVLDELGLVTALREAAAQYGPLQAGATADGADRPSICIDALEPLPSLPAAVELAAYRIVQEALTNVVRHSQARVCLVRLRLEDGLVVEISDDGRGLADDRHVGVGLASMRERAAELGGTCLVETKPEGGTRVLVQLPVRREVSGGSD